MSHGAFLLAKSELKFIKVAYPSSISLLLYKLIKRIGGNIVNAINVHHLKHIINRVLAVVKPSGNVCLNPEPKFNPVIKRGSPIKFLSANLWHDWPRYRLLEDRLNCFVELVLSEEADILLLQEISRTKDFHADRWLGDRLGMAYIYSRSNGNAAKIGFEEGLAIFSRFPIRGQRLAQLSNHLNPFSRRMALGASIDTAGGIIDVYSVHLGILGSQNKKQFSHLSNWVEEQSQSVPVVVGGDFNAGEKSSQIHETNKNWFDSYRAMNPEGSAFSHELRLPWGSVLKRSRLDYLFFRRGEPALRVNEARYLDSFGCSISDHRPILAQASFLPS